PCARSRRCISTSPYPPRQPLRLPHVAIRGSHTPIMAPRPSITGFDPKKFAAAAGRGTQGDPWARYEQWRYTGPFTRFNRFKGSFPGLGIATVAFAGYCIAEQLLWKDDHAHHDEGAH
ncbi:hypothetical protein NX059_001955, partial [Plenodomus lindquistii]